MARRRRVPDTTNDIELGKPPDERSNPRQSSLLFLSPESECDDSYPQTGFRKLPSQSTHQSTSASRPQKTPSTLAREDNSFRLMVSDPPFLKRRRLSSNLNRAALESGTRSLERPTGGFNSVNDRDFCGFSFGGGMNGHEDRDGDRERERERERGSSGLTVDRSSSVNNCGSLDEIVSSELGEPVDHDTSGYDRQLLVSQFFCAECSKTFFSSIQRSNHVRTCHQMTSVSSLHGNTVTRAGDGRYPCPLDCGKRMNRADSLWRHYNKCRGRSSNASAVDIIAPWSTENVVEFIDTWNAAVFRVSGLVLVICLNCNMCLHPVAKSVTRHFKDCKHKKRSLDSSRVNVSEIDTHLAAIGVTGMVELKATVYMRPTEVPLDPVPGLPITMGFKCQECIYYSSKKSTMVKHRSAKHNRSTAESAKCAVQTLFRDNNRVWFGINWSEQRSHDSVCQEIRMSLSQKSDQQPNGQDPYVPSVTQLAPWLRLLRWDEVACEVLADFSLTKVSATISSAISANEPKHHHYIGRLVEVYMETVQKVIKNIAYIYRRQIMTSGKDLAVVGFNCLQEPSTRRRYSEMMTRLLLAMLRSEFNDDGMFAPVIPSDCTPLSNAIHRLSYHLSHLSQEPPIDRSLSSLKCVHDVVLAIATPQLDESSLLVDSSSVCLQIRFIVLVSLKIENNSYAFNDIRYLTQPMAIFLYWTRASILMELGKSCWVSNSPALSQQHVDGLLNYIREGQQNTPMVQLRQVMRLAFSVLADAPVKPQLVELNSEIGCALNGQEIRLDQIKRMLQKLRSEASSIMKQDVLRGLDTEWIVEALSGTVHDELNNTAIGYSFLNDEKNPFIHHRDDLVNYLLDPKRYQQLVVGFNQNRGVEWRRDRLRCWMNAASKLHSIMWMLLHLCAGLPPRGNEYRSYLTRNTAVCPRTFYYVKGKIMTFQNYHKGASTGKSAQKLIPRFLPSCLSRMFIEFLLLVRPFQCTAASELYKDADPRLYLDVWAVGNCKLQDGSILSSALQDQFMLHCSTTFGIKDYRHIAVFLADHIQKSNADLPIAWAAGHSNQTAAHHYAQREQDHRYINRQTLRDFREVSELWHGLIGMTGNSSVDSLLPASGERVQHVISELRQDDDTQARLYTIMTRVQHIDVRYSKQNIESPDPFFCRQAHQALQTLGHQQWRSAEQAIATSRVLEGLGFRVPKREPPI